MDRTPLRMQKSAFKIAETAEQPEFINVSRLHSIKTRIVAFAIVATVLPALTLGSLAYMQITRFLNQKISQDLKNVTAQVSRELDLSIKERIYDVRVFASSYIVTENLAKILRKKSSRVERRASLNVIKDYLQSVRNKFIDYKELLIVDLQGELMATSNAPPGNNPSPDIPPHWITEAKSGRSVIGEAYFDPELGARVMVIGEPIRNANNELMGVLGAKLSVQPIDAILAGHTQSDADTVFLINSNGKVLTGTGVPNDQPIHKGVDPDILIKLLAHRNQPTTYSGSQGLMVIGIMTTVPALDWAVVVEVDKDKAYTQVQRLQRLTLLVAGGMLALIGACAYLLALTIVQPLKRLSQGADRVAGGDLHIDLPISNRSEVGYLTQVFNHMVAKLRQNQEELATVNAELQEKNQELQLLSITDPLTGLFNRKYLMEKLAAEIIRSLRHKHTFALLIIDIDHFKHINDTYGHQKGDEVLRHLADVFTKSIRECDYVARYGGEEFVVLLPETGQNGAIEAAERIRISAGKAWVGLADETISVTVSIGLSLFPDNGDDVRTVIQQADKALYAAKDSGRNRTVTSMVM
jgi:diguanylate cyclase (GGDEF)-like protein